MDHVHPGHKSCSFLCACLWVGCGSTASTFFYVDARLPQASEPAADPTRNCELGFAVHIFFAVRSASRVGHFFARPPRAFFGCSNILLVLRRRLRFFCPPLRKEMRCIYATEIASWGLRRSFFSQFAVLVERDIFSPGRRGLALGVRKLCSCRVPRRRPRFFCSPLRKEMRCVYATEIASWGLWRSLFLQFAVLVEWDIFSPGRRGLSFGVQTFCSCCAAGLGFFALPFGRRCGASTLLKLRAGVCGAVFFRSSQC